MGTREETTPTKTSKPPSSTQGAPATPSYPDWSSSMQAYYNGAAPPFYASAVPSPTPHPYMWGGQHPMMPPYGTPVPYPALYPHGGVYAHPPMPVAPGTAMVTNEPEVKAAEAKDKAPSKKSKGISGNTGGKTGESGTAVASGGSGNDGATQSAESGSDGSSDASDENNNNDFSGMKKGGFNQMLADGANAQNNAIVNYQSSVPGNPVVSVPVTNLNIGMDLWNASSAGTAMPGKMRTNQSGGDQLGQQDERELKRQKRKQSNRESARRSRLRKQAECEELQHKVENLSNDNRIIRGELQRLSKECEKLTSDNNSIKEELTRLCGPEAISKLENNNSALHLQSRGDEGNS